MKSLGYSACITYKNKEEVIELLNTYPSPLALYIMSNKKEAIDYFLNNTVAGGTCINELMLTSVNPHLPFGGVNNSGVGKTGGKHSFMDFSNQRGVIKRKFGNSLKLIYPHSIEHIQIFSKSHKNII